MQIFPTAKTHIFKRQLMEPPTTVEMLKLGAPRNKKVRITSTGEALPYGFLE